MLQKKIMIDTLKAICRDAKHDQIDPFCFLNTFIYCSEYLHKYTAACKDGFFPTISSYKNAVDELCEIFDEELFDDVELYNMFHNEVPAVYLAFIIVNYKFDLAAMDGTAFSYGELVTWYLKNPEPR